MITANDSVAARTTGRHAKYLMFAALSSSSLGDHDSLYPHFLFFILEYRLIRGNFWFVRILPRLLVSLESLCVPSPWLLLWARPRVSYQSINAPGRDSD